MELDEKISTDIIVSALVNLSQKIRGLVFIPIITKALGTGAYGAYVQTLVFATLFATISRLGLERALIRYVQENDGENDGQLYISLTLFALIVGILFSISMYYLSSVLSSVFLGGQEYVGAIRVGSVLIPIYILQIMAQNWFRAEMGIKKYSIIEGIKTYINVIAVSISVLIFGLELTGVILVVVLTEMVFGFIVQAMVLHDLGIQYPTVENFDIYLRYSIPASIADFFGTFQDRADRLLIGYFLGANAVGIYSIAYSIGQIIRMYTLPLRITFFPEFSRLWAQDKHDICYKYLRSGSRYLVGLAVPSAVGLYLIGEQFIRLLAGEEIAAQAAFLLPIISLGFMFIGLEVLYRQLFYAAEKTMFASAIRVFGTFLNVLLNLIFIPIYGILGAAVATLVTNILAFIILYSIAQQRFQIGFERRFMAKSFAASAIMLSVVSLIGIQNMILILVISPPIYVTSMVLTRGITIGEISFIVELVR